MVERPTLILLHGGPGADHTFFKPEFAAMADTAQVIYLDQRGSGRSDHADARTWTWTQWADDVAGFARVLGLGQVILVGSSSGGMVGLVCAARHPDLVAGLVLDSPLGTGSTLEESLDVFERRGGRQAREAAQRYLGGDLSPAAAQAWQAYGLPLYGSGAGGDLTLRRARARINDAVQQHFRAGGCGPADASGFAPAITAPTLILAGADDPVAPAVGARRLAGTLGGRLEILAGVGHGVFRQAPEPAFASLKSFVDNL